MARGSIDGRWGGALVCMQMKHSPEFERFDALVNRVLAVPHSVIKERVEQERKKSAAKAVRPGPKPKRKITPPSASAPSEADR